MDATVTVLQMLLVDLRENDATCRGRVTTGVTKRATVSSLRGRRLALHDRVTLNMPLPPFLRLRRLRQSGTEACRRAA